jgi:hypothetical protein
MAVHDDDQTKYFLGKIVVFVGNYRYNVNYNTYNIM